ncbi:hypothetical protein PG997_004657 [Apiospora hydei]|uniref:Uncharacterized protein n=1 Tax=Apiospora hydei TaxID=1337664 RepID=A0ABR1X2S8_9PEZI
MPSRTPSEIVTITCPPPSLPSSSYNPKPSHLPHELLPNDADLRAARVHEGGVEVAGAHAADVVEAPAGGAGAGALRLGRVAAGAGRVARVVAALVGEGEELAAGQALVVGPAAVVLAVRAPCYQARARALAEEAGGGVVGAGASGEGLARDRGVAMVWSGGGGGW